MEALLIALIIGVLSFFGLGGSSTQVLGASDEGVIVGMPPEYLDDPGASDPIYAQWLEREQLPDCGFFDPDLVDGGGSGPVGWDCLEEARASGRGGEMVIQFLTQEGDPVVVWHRITPEGAYETYTDATQDNFGSGEWEYSTCSKPGKALDRRTCLE